MNFIELPLYIVTIREIFSLVRFMSVSDNQIIGYDEENNTFIISRFGTAPDSAVSIARIGPQNMFIGGNNSNIRIISDRKEAEATFKDLNFKANLIEACRRVKEKNSES